MTSDRDESATQLLHRLTSYEPGREWDHPLDDPRILQDFEPNDFSRLPWRVKQYDHALPRVPLPRQWPEDRVPALAVLAGTAGPDAVPLDLAGLSRLLHLSAGVVRTLKRELTTILFRAAGSAGGRFPLELYVAVPDGSDDSDGPDSLDGPEASLPPGVHWYDPVEHELVQVGPPPRTAGTAPAAATIVVTGVPWRTGWRYAERGFRHVYWDAGTLLSQLLALAESGGCAPRLHTRFPDARVSELVGADGVHEWPVAVVALGAGAPATAASGPAVRGSTDAEPLEFPLVTAAQRAGDVDLLGEAWPAGAVVDAPVGVSAPLDEVITKRGSQRRMDPGHGLPLATLRTCMTLALRGIDVDHWVAVHDVAGLEPGIYRWPDLGTPIHADSRERMRAELHRVCLDQALGRDAAFVVIAATDVSRLSDRRYREAQLAAGIAEGRLHLTAYALGAGATGMTFLDSEIPALLAGGEAGVGGEVDGLIFTCVGVPGNTSKPAGRPGEPTEIRAVPPRE